MKLTLHPQREVDFYSPLRKILLIMKLSIFFLLLGMLNVSASVFSQNIHVSFNQSQVKMGDALSIIEKNSNYRFFFRNDQVDLDRMVKVEREYNNVNNLLDNLVSRTNIIYKMVDNNLIILSTNNVKKVTIRGQVIDNKQEPLIGATILEKGTNNGIVTDLNGRFSLEVSEGSTIVVSFIGMITQEIKIAGKLEFSIMLEPTNEMLDEVMVTGYQSIPKERSTGAFTKISSKALEIRRKDNLSSMLEGQIAGFVDGKIRGVTTMNAVANPMVVIDGFPVENTSMDKIGRTFENMPDINPEDIESVTVLKDAAAASIYGARAANGVIVITTKKAKEGKAEVSFSSTFTMRPYSYYTGNMTSSADVVALQKAWAEQNAGLVAGGASAEGVAADLRNNGAYPSKGVDILLDMYTEKISMSEGNQALSQLASMGYKYYDQVGQYTKRDPMYQQYNLRIGKTTNNNSFNFSATYWDNKYEDVNRNDNKLGLNFTNSLRVTRWLEADLGVYLKNANDRTQYFNPLAPGFSVMPYDMLVAADGSYVPAVPQDKKERRDFIEQYKLYPETLIPMNELNYQLSNNKVYETRAFGKLKVEFTPWLNYNAMYQYETSNGNQKRVSELESNSVATRINNFASLSNGTVVYNLPAGDIWYTNENTKNSYNFRQQLNFNKTFSEKHNVVALLGQEVRHSKIEYYENALFGYDDELLTWPAFNEKQLSYFSGLLGTARLNHSDVTSLKQLVNRFVSLYSNASYSFDDKYVVSGSIRWDRSNLWGTSSKFQNKPLWSVGAGWNIDREDFFNVEFIDLLKLRGSYGIGGNIGRNTAPYLVASYYAATYADGLAGVVVSPPNNDIRWEKTTSFNVGFDFAMLKNRLTGTIDYYKKHSVDLLAFINGSATQGFGYAGLTTNNGRMWNRGFELTLQGEIIRASDFSWNARLLYSLNKNEVEQVSIKAAMYDSRLTLPLSYPTVGNSFFGIYGYKWAGLDENGDPQVYDAKGNITSEDVRDADAIVYQGTTIPEHSGSFTNIFSYKDFEFSAMVMFAVGHKVRDPFTPQINMADGRITSTNKDIMNRWQKPGDELVTDVPRLLFSNDTENYNTYRTTLYRYSDLFIYDASHIRLNNLSLAYRLPAAICNKVHLMGAKVQFNIENVAVFAFDNRAHYALGGKVKPNYVWGLYLNF